ncbi:MAG: SDR family NAD(P)-dependent oxidoreductase [Dokdonella sp.]|uniref:SDR family NAD(P)-dependent oxidoreductase n=1 Tax=Dokdonella sp. TaxID=2291710 RepID=UPI002C942B1D|nr:SDR family NAD(P)-dependent oxidoreductase [Xanthomonadales bacterium]HQV73452.1 SDR family NAD(P)-dependent oxidoreductase [Dokdonella sp.]HQW77489.1 SDR family NAD(P)-dependent oxidoreductase [Dokdonella sp.]HQX66252.1 SDR family NAD(P)-dependent oxidoreductase [Dokdonella sp.]HQY55214.1 SDR family NAD(P)-dependent oxidoreductase [Dokdonella sp.]
MTAIVVGASSGLGRALALELARSGKPLLLIASDARDLDAMASDLRLRFKATVATLAVELAASADPGARILASLADLPPASMLLLAVGMSRSDDDGTLGAVAVGQLLAINLHVPIAITQALLPALLESRGTIVGFGSIAGTRGRSRNIVYAAAKRGLETFFQSLRHRHLPSSLRVQFYRLGFLRSNLTFGLKLPLPVAEPADVARKVVAQLQRGSFARHEPRWWGIIALLVRNLPWFAFRRMRD